MRTHLTAIAIVAALLSTSVVVHAQDAAKPDAAKSDVAKMDQAKPAGDESDSDCDGGTLQLIECIGAKTQPWDKRLNAAYKSALADARPEQRNALRAAQRAWITYRDANCEYYNLGEGSLSRVEVADCDFRMTRDRAKELENGSGIN
jgi:uncharacterized protein YecT (DUF1311 family)